MLNRNRAGVRAPGRSNARTSGGILVVAFVGLAFVLGGASGPESTAAFILQILSAILIAAAAFQRGATQSPAMSRLLLVGASAYFALILVHLAPLPPQIWAGLPGRSFIAESLALAGTPQRWMPLSLVPQSTVRAMLGVLPVACLILLLVRQTDIPFRSVALLVVGLALVSLLLGILQLNTGTRSPFYLHHITNRTLAVGFFASANHLSTLFLISIPLFAAIAFNHARRAKWRMRSAAAATCAYAAILGVGIYLTASVAGAVLLVPTTAASLLLFARLNSKATVLIALAALGAGVAGLAAWTSGSLDFLQTSLGSDPLDRLGIFRTTLVAIREYWPVGAGFGTFEQVYPLFEEPGRVTGRYVNHAHNDYLEIVLDAGLPGAIAIGLFLLWWADRLRRVWSGDSRRDLSIWKRAATIVIGVVLAHSLVDYPLRTPAILVLFTFMALFLAAPAEQREPRGAAQGA